MYEIFAKLLKEKGIKTSTVATSTGISNMTFSDWKSGKSTPKADKLQKIADYFGITVDYLIGKNDHINCSICHNTYNPLNSNEVNAHDEFHDKYLKALKKYKLDIIPSWGNAFDAKNDAAFKFNKYNATTDERLKAYDDYLKNAYFLMLWDNGLNLDCEDFDSYCAKNIGLADTKQAADSLENGLYQKLIDKYGIAEEKDYHKVSRMNEKGNREIGYDLDRILKEIENDPEGPLFYKGKPIDDESLLWLRDVLKLGLNRLKAKNDIADKK